MQLNENLQESSTKLRLTKNDSTLKGSHSRIVSERQLKNLEKNPHFSNWEKRELVKTLNPDDIRNLNSHKLAILNYLLSLSNTCLYVFPSQFTIGDAVGLSDRSIRKEIKPLIENGYIETYQRWDNSLIYKLNKSFTYVGFRKLLSDILPSLKHYSLLVLLANNNAYGNIPKNIDLEKEFRVSKRVGLFKYLYLSCNRKLTNVSKPTFSSLSPNGHDPGRDTAKNIQIENGVSGMEKTNPIPDYIRNLKALKLTKWGQIKLCAFSPGTIAYASKKNLPTKGNMKDLFGLFMYHCLQYCKQYGIKPNWQLVDKLKAKYKQPLDARMTLLQETPPRISRVVMQKIYDEQDEETEISFLSDLSEQKQKEEPPVAPPAANPVLALAEKIRHKEESIACAEQKLQEIDNQKGGLATLYQFMSKEYGMKIIQNDKEELEKLRNQYSTLLTPRQPL